MNRRKGLILLIGLIRIICVYGQQTPVYTQYMFNPFIYNPAVAGIDPYRQGKSAYSSSLGSVYIYKRMHAISGDKYQDMFVASYCARPDKKETWNFRK